MAIAYPIIGKWFRQRNGSIFEVVAVDEEDGTIEILYFDGTLEEFELVSWPDIFPLEIGPPEDWSGSVDMDPDDFVGRKEGEMPSGYHDPFEFLEEPD
jgi:hypothetical protein